MKPNPRNDFDPLGEEEYASLKENIAQNGILDALTVKKDGTIITGENRYRIALELKEHENEMVRRRVQNIPVRYYMNELTLEEEYDILEGDNLFRRHLTAEQRKERLKKRILRKYKDELVQDNRGGDRKSESLKPPGENTEEETKQELSSSMEEQTDPLSDEMELGLFGEVGTIKEQAQESEGLKEGSKYQGDILKTGSEKSKVQGELLKQGSNEKSKDDPHLLIGNSSRDLAKKVSENENIPLGTAKNYISELKKELKTKDPKSVAKEEKAAKKKAVSRNVLRKEKAKQFQKKYAKLTVTGKQKEADNLVSKIIKIRKKWKKLNEEIQALSADDADLVEMLTAIGQTKRIHGLRV
ncbi:chromosome partitioning protein ParB [Leptospira interrogans]|uniref:chromosome partitioning protein ParB n=1 Tax=Leptospira interrogans TaxID=173 RepID=UPI001F19028E|nr:chromosome partitioning protein ParB [Leptospira interrogans]